MEILLWLLALLSMAIIAIQITYESTLIQEIKSLLHLHKPPSCIIKLLNISLYKSFLNINKWMWLTLPLMLLLFVMSNIYAKLVELLNCPYCLVFHLSWLMLYFYFNHNMIEALIYAPIGIFFVYLCEKLNG